MSTATTQIIISGKDNLSSVAANAGRRLGTEMQAAQRSVASLSGAFGGLAGIAGGLSLAQFGKSIFDAAVAADALQRSFIAISGSQTGAAEYVSYLRTEADRLGQSFYDLAPAFKNIAAAARGTALEGEPVRKVFSAIAEASTALGMSTADTEGSLRALGQMISKGNVQAEELRGQLGERIPGAFNLAAKAMGVGTAELNKMLQQGKVLATDLLPKLADEIHKAYGAAAQTSALESAQAAVNRLSGAWVDFKVGLYSNEPAVAGINAITDALKELSDEANSLSRIRKDMFRIGETLSSPDFLAADRDRRLQLVSMGVEGESSYRNKVNRKDVRTAPIPIAESGQSVAIASTKREADRAEKAYNKMIVDGRKASVTLDEYWKNYEDARITALAGGVEARSQAEAKNLELVTEFSEKYRAAVLGETEFKLAQISIQAEAYRAAGAEEVAVRQWAESEKMRFSRSWEDGARLGLAEYANNATNAAMLAHDAIVGGFQGMEDALVSFVTTGKLEFSDLANSIISDLARVAIQQSITAPLASGLGSIIGGLFGPIGSMVGGLFGGASSAAGFGIAGELSSFMSLNAKGNVFESPGLHAYANSIVSSPTVFPFARGVGLMGEAGPEAIMPLKRGPDGTLGVRGGGTNVQVNVINNANAQASVKETKTQDGGVRLDVIIEDIVARSVTGRGKVGQAIQTAFRAQYKGA